MQPLVITGMADAASTCGVPRAGPQGAPSGLCCHLCHPCLGPRKATDQPLVVKGCRARWGPAAITPERCDSQRAGMSESFFLGLLGSAQAKNSTPAMCLLACQPICSSSAGLQGLGAENGEEKKKIQSFPHQPRPRGCAQ